ncbi:uncharacterized protein [Setaria viridis]|uniref:uncharacterized protein n=1 Tax=Setaria viridis TaxID=4556 RepID=UPI003B3BCDBC
MVHMESLRILGLGSNHLEGQIPDMPTSLEALDLSNNSFTGPLPYHLGGSGLLFVSLSNNHLNGSIPVYFCDMELLSGIDLSNNNLSGELPNCWKQNTRLFVLDFSNNNLEGEIPSSIGSLTSLASLHLNKNMLSGVLPFSLSSCDSLILLDLGENHFEGTIPTWIGSNMHLLVILRLRSNQFSGNIPDGLSQLQHLQVLDLANNKLSGPLPRNIGNFTWMASRQSAPITSFMFRGFDVGYIVIYSASLYITTKGDERLYSRILYLMTSIDLSDNALTGEIPVEFGALAQLKNLNLSRNRLSGRIPERIGSMDSLESLDISWNHLSGAIPQSMASLHSLSRLNMSYNNLSGKIPQGSQLQTLGDEDPYIYAGNKYLCSPLVSESCYEHKLNPIYNDEDTHAHDVLLYVVSGLGFGLGFSAIWWLLIFNEAVRKLYFQSIDSVCEKFFVRI